MKYTLLDLTQEIAISLSSDEVNSITDTVESQSIAHIIRTVYLDIIARADLPEHFSLVNLDPSGDSTKPTLMSVPATVSEVCWIKYDNQTTDLPYLDMKPVAFMGLVDFLSMVHQFDLAQTDVYGSYVLTTSSPSSITVPYRKDKAPQWYTSFDDHTLLFDSYDNTVDTTLQSSKSLAYSKLVIPFTMSDTFTPNLDEAQFQLLLNEAKAMAWAELKQAQHAKAEVNSKRGWTRLQRTKNETERLSPFDRLPNYGRK